jgi:hypothetical protein
MPVQGGKVLQQSLEQLSSKQLRDLRDQVGAGPGVQQRPYSPQVQLTGL